MSRLTRKHVTASMLALGALGSLAAATLTLPSPAAAQLTVFDPSNYSQNVLSAARALQQINNQIQALQNQATMLRNMERNLTHIDFPELQTLLGQLREIDRLIQQAKGIDFRAASVDAQFRALFPDFDAQVSGSARAAQARSRLDTAMAGFRHTMQVQAQIAETVQADAAMLASLSGKSQAADGALQLGQAGNQLLALGAKQQMQIQELLAAQFRAQAVEQARQAQAELDGRAATKKFLGTGKAYTPR
ncbi:MAG: P-type conjugative transfer protein TrbJ [Sphingomonas sp.]